MRCEEKYFLPVFPTPYLDRVCGKLGTLSLIPPPPPAPYHQALTLATYTLNVPDIPIFYARDTFTYVIGLLSMRGGGTKRPIEHPTPLA